MKISCIFADVLYSFYVKNRKTEWDIAYKNLTNLEFLESFFEEHEKDLINGYYKGRVQDVTEAISLTRKMAHNFFHKVIKYCKQGDNLDTLFKNLNRYESALAMLTLSKIQNVENKCDWLRIYGIRVDNGIYTVTGGTIKLTLEMKDRPHTKNELKKLGDYKDCLNDSCIFDKTDLYNFVENI